MEKTKDLKKASSTRIPSIDRLRGLSILLMVISFLLGVFEDSFSVLAPWVGHGDKGVLILPGVSVADLFAPIFIFVLGLTFVKSFKARELKYGSKQAFAQMATRFLGIIGLGALLNGFEDGLLEIFQGDLFSELAISKQIFTVGFVLSLAVVLAVIVTSFIKNKKAHNVCVVILKYYLAAVGVLALYFILVSTGERVTRPAEYRYGGWMWDTLQNIGLAGLVALPFIKYDKWGRLVMVSIFFTALTIFAQNGGFPLMRQILEGGVFGAFTWAGILLLGSVFMDFKDDKVLFWSLATVLIALSLTLILGFDFIAAKRGATPVYGMFTAGVAAVVWAGLQLLNNWKPKFAFLSWWGSSSLLTYVLIYLVANLIGIVLVLTEAVVTVWVAVLISLAVLVLFTVMNWYLVRKNKFVRL